MALITAGMPVLNAGKTIARALDDLLNQTFEDFVVIICDNASDDDTASIAARYAKRDSRIVFKHFDERVDIRLSFKRTLDAATTPYFMFTPADDRWYREFMAANLAVLEADKQIAASTGRVAFFKDNRFSHISTGTRPLDGTIAENTTSYLRDPGENARAFSLIRREAMQGSFPDRTYPGWDFQMTARTLKAGAYHEIPDVLAERDITPVEGYVRQAEVYFGSNPARIVPLHRFALEAIKDRAIAPARGKRRALFSLMCRSHATYARYRMARWNRILEKTQSAFQFDDFPRVSGD